MARFDRLTVLNAMLETGMVPVFYNGDLDVAKKIVAACAEGGAKLVEFTNRGDRAWNIFTELIAFAERSHPELILGVGSVIDMPTAALYIASGANFIVGPVLNSEIARLCNRRKIAYSPGCGTASEISEAEELGVEIVKIFPGGLVGGPAFVRAIHGPMPWTRLMPTGGVDATKKEAVQEWIRAGAACLGIGSTLIRKDLVAAGDFAAIRDNVRQVLAWIREARKVRWHDPPQERR
jgi:2-dehydro-3-deoxyphosphogluconate aldolase/(4S)-4-hydroxy-2-oxoglutarate aldolase